MSKEEIIAAIKDTAEKLGGTPTILEVTGATGVTKQQIHTRFGSYGQALTECGLEIVRKQRPTAELFEAWAVITRKLGRVPSFNEFRAMGSVSAETVLTRFGKWSLVKSGMQQFMEQQKLEAEWADVAEIVRSDTSTVARVRRVRTRLTADEAAGAAGERSCAAGKIAGECSRRTGAEAARERFLRLPNLAAPGGAWWRGREADRFLLPPAAAKPGRPFYGMPMTRTAVVHEPVNEAAVLALFSELAYRLGFLILRVQAGFPDVEALRRVKGGRWQRWLVELEYESKGFVAHGHDPAGCDLIVCWMHNWEECPVEVIELSRVIGISG